MTQLTDAIGNPITEGYAVHVEPGRGSVYSRKVYVVGTKGSKVTLLGSRWGNSAYLEELVAGHKEGNQEVPTYTTVTTRIIMLNPKENN